MKRSNLQQKGLPPLLRSDSMFSEVRACFRVINREFRLPCRCCVRRRKCHFDGVAISHTSGNRTAGFPLNALTKVCPNSPLT